VIIQGHEASTKKEGEVSHIFVSDMAKAKIINEKTAYEELNHQKVIPKLTYYTRSYSTINNEITEYGPGFILSFIENLKNDEGYTLVVTESEFPIFVGPSTMFDQGAHLIDWVDDKFKLNSIPS
jgi:hypothetical protein